MCSIHQNFDLLLRATKTNLTYQEIIPQVVCDETRQECMLRLCPECSSNLKIQKFIDETFRPVLSPETSDLESEYDDEITVSFKEWISTDGVN